MNEKKLSFKDESQFINLVYFISESSKSENSESEERPCKTSLNLEFLIFISMIH